MRLKLLVLAAAGSMAPSACQTAQPAPAAPAGAIALTAAPALPAGAQRVRIADRQGGMPGMTVSMPPGWRHDAPEGEDTAIHVFAGPDVMMQFEYWLNDANLSCRSASCGLVQMPVADRHAAINLASNRRNFQAFVPVVPRNGPGPPSGLRASAQCGSAPACEQALAVLASLRFS